MKWKGIIKEGSKIIGISIEYGHTYLGDPPTEEAGIAIAKDIEDIATNAGVGVSRLVLIDDYNRSGEGKEEYASFYSKHLEFFGMKPTHIVWEGDCVGPAKTLLDSLREVPPGANLLGKYFKGENMYVSDPSGKRIKVRHGMHYQCPVLAAVSELSQLGLVDVPYHATGELRHYKGKAAVVVLPMQYRPVEENANRLISLLYGDEHAIHRFFFDGRPSKDYVASWLVQNEVINDARIP